MPICAIIGAAFKAPNEHQTNYDAVEKGESTLRRQAHILDFNEARDYQANLSARARARVAAADRLARRQEASHRRAIDAREAGQRRGRSIPFSRRVAARNVSTRAGTRYAQDWELEEYDPDFDYGEYGYDADAAYDEVSDGYTAYDDADYDESDAFRAAPGDGPIKRFHKHMRKRRAERMAERAVGADTGPDAAPAADAPRAALYEMKMGTQHKHVVRMQDTSARAQARTRTRRSIVPHSRFVRVLGALVACTVAVATFLYPAARDYYVAVRDHAKAEAAVELAQERNAILEQDVAALSTPEGIEDRARSEYGWVKEGENAVTVTGLAPTTSGAQRIEDLPAVESVQAPETWYSNVLDRVFGYEG